MQAEMFAQRVTSLGFFFLETFSPIGARARMPRHRGSQQEKKELESDSMDERNDRPHRTPVRRGEGVTPAERYLKGLADRTFLSLWSYPGLYRAAGEELCDLLVVFEDDIIIFSDKNCKFPDTGNLRHDWDRWFRRAVAASVRQVVGAERWIRTHPHRIYLDRKAQIAFPIEIPDPGSTRFHLVVVAHGVEARCMKEFGGGCSGSLIIESDRVGIENHTQPFVIGDLNPGGSFVHFLSDTSLSIVLSTVDTISDLTAYLRKKEALLRSRQRVWAAGEEDLLAVYAKRIDADGQHGFDLPADVDAIALQEGQWDNYQRNPQRLAKLEADRISYAWDSLIEVFNKHALNGTQFNAWPPGIRATEKVNRMMAREPRLRRRILARTLLEILESTPAEIRRLRVIQPSRPGDPYFVFLLFPVWKDKSYQDNRLARQAFLEACCGVVKLVYPDALDIVGIATESGRGNEGSEDAMYLDAREWTEEMNAQARRDQIDLQILTRGRVLDGGTEQEYPKVKRRSEGGTSPSRSGSSD